MVMGIIQSFCCGPGGEPGTPESQQQQPIRACVTPYGACTPIVYKIVLPAWIRMSIDLQPKSVNNSNKDNNQHNNSDLGEVAGPTDEQTRDRGEQDDDDNDEDDDSSIDEKDEITPKRRQPKVATLVDLETDSSEQQNPAVIKEEYCAEQFIKIRSLIMKTAEDEQLFRELLWSCIPWTAPGGKSGSTFLKTVDDQFILKEMSKLELQSFLSISDDYFNYIEKSNIDDQASLLSTILGIYRIAYTPSASRTSSEYYFMVMRNLFYKRNISQRFDLKGSMRNRLVDTDDPDNDEHVLMDENLMRINCEKPLIIHESSKQILNQAIDNDSKFLSSISVMDYSLLVGVDREKHELVLGIIDYVRPFTWDKKIERVVKSVVSTELPTIIEPSLYRERFCEAMDKYFQSIPDSW